MKITAAELKELLLEETAYAGECGHIVDGIHGLVKDMDPHDVSEIFQTVFAQLPGVELMQPGEEAPEGEEEESLPTPYQHGGETGDRPVIGFREQLMEMVRQELGENTYMDRLKSGDISDYERRKARSQKRVAERKADYEAGYAHAQEGGKCIADKDTTRGVGVPCTGTSSWEEGFLAGREGL